MQPHPGIWQEPITISSFDAGASGHLEAAALMRHFQETAARHAAHLKVGFDDLRHENIFWALTHIQTEISRWPDMNETVWIETWPRGIEKLYTTRDYRVKDQSGNTIINATSAWIMVDIERKRPVRPSARLSDIPFVPEVKALGNFPETVQEWDEAKETATKERKVVYSDLDINRHVNNTRYVEWIMDAMAPSNQKQLKSLHLRFMHEFLAEETALLKMNPNSEKQTFQISITHRESKKTGCLGFLAFYRD